MNIGKIKLSEHDYKSEIVFFIIVYLLVCGFILAFSPLVLLYVGHDITPVLDGVWRIESGQIPHKDFSSILGHGYLLHQYVFLKIFSYDFIAFTVSSIAITTIIFLIFLSFYSSTFFQKHTNRFYRFYLFFLIVALGLGQYHLGAEYQSVTYANLYNRYCFLCLLIILVLLILLKEQSITKTKVLSVLIIVGLLLNYLLFVKITYFGVAVGLLMLFTGLKYIHTKISFLLLLISLVIFAIVLLATNADFLSIINDYKTISSARKVVLIREKFLLSKFWHLYGIVYLLSLILLLIELLIRRISFKFIVLVLFLGISSVLLHLTNWGNIDIVMLSFVPVAFILLPQKYNFLSLKLVVAVSAIFILKNLLSIFELSKAREANYSELKSKYLSNFFTNWKEFKCDEDYAAKVMKGVDLINRNKMVGDKVLAFAFDNPFPFLSQTIPPKHVPTVWQAGTTYTYDVYPNAKILFSDVTLLMIPTCLKAELATEMMNLYGRTVNEHYKKIAGNEYWNLYRKIKSL